jgi:hypothetical protein
VSTYLELAGLKDDVRTLSDAELSAKHGDAFLVHHGALNLPTLAHAGKTQRVEGPAAGSDGPTRPQVRILALRKGARSPYADFISLGRAGNNDIVLEDASLSKFHAYVRKLPDGSYVLQDAGSRNGTWLDDRQVPTRERGAAVVLTSGCSVRLGGVVLSFVSTPGLRILLTRLFGQP